MWVVRYSTMFMCSQFVYLFVCLFPSMLPESPPDSSSEACSPAQIPGILHRRLHSIYFILQASTNKFTNGGNS